MKFSLCLISCLMLLCVAIVTVLGLCFSLPKQTTAICGVAPDIIKAAHRYHGILHAQKVEYHEWEFYREDEWCKLFTDNFLKSYGRRKRDERGKGL